MVLIRIEKYPDEYKKYKAKAEGSNQYGLGKDMFTAVGDLVLSHPELFGVRLVFGKGVTK